MHEARNANANLKQPKVYETIKDERPRSELESSRDFYRGSRFLLRFVPSKLNPPCGKHGKRQIRENSSPSFSA